ncbi:MAG: hypothetical protein DYG88_18230 [Chloroflexi bacterium CFX4]|nr:hypothetical protein [Chloroflexi bacterium CFX4]MDL1924409.1 hypothetical protein [Chloroflexi bacterium CFX3]
MRKMLLLTLIACLAWLGSPAPSHAEDDSLIATLLRAVPLRELAFSDIASYLDYAALQKTLPNSVRPFNMQNFNMLSGTAPVAWYRAGLNNLAAGDANLLEVALRGDEMRQFVGFDFFSIDQVVAFGNAPGDGRLYTGRFNVQAVEAAFLARDYTKFERDGLSVFCGDAACDRNLALRTDVSNRRVGDPFGGNLGRREPIALAPNLIMNSPDMRVFDGMVTAYNGGSPSLTQNTDVRALLAALTAEGTVVQANIFSAYVIGPVQRGDDGIAPYTLAALVHLLREDGSQPVYIALTYAEESVAQAAGEALAARIQGYQSSVARRPFAQLLAERGGTLEAAQIVQPEEGASYVLLLPISSAPPTGIPAERDVMGYRPPDALMIYRLFMNALYQQDLGFLAVSQ